MHHHSFAGHVNCFRFSRSMNRMEKQFCKQSDVAALVPSDTREDALCCGHPSSRWDGWADLAAFFSGFQVATVTHAGWEKVSKGVGEAVSPFYCLKAEIQRVDLSNLRQSKKPVARLQSALKSQPQTDGRASSTTVLLL